MHEFANRKKTTKTGNGSQGSHVENKDFKLVCRNENNNSSKIPK